MHSGQQTAILQTPKMPGFASSTPPSSWSAPHLGPQRPHCV